MKYLFETDQFRFSADEIHLLRSRFPYKKIAFQDIDAITITRGVTVKRPMFLLLFGLFLILGSLSLTPLFLDAIWLLINDFVDAWDLGEFVEVLGWTLYMTGTIIILGCISIYHATVPKLIIKTTFKDGSFMVFRLRKIKQKKMLPDLIYFI